LKVIHRKVNPAADFYITPKDGGAQLGIACCKACAPQVNFTKNRGFPRFVERVFSFGKHTVLHCQILHKITPFAARLGAVFSEI